MTNKNKIKGSKFERDFAQLMNDLVDDSNWKRVPGSGAIGTIVGETFLTGDINGKVTSMEKTFKVEAKVGYGGATQLTLKKEWLDKIREEADNAYAIPMLACKFLGARKGVRTFIVLEPKVFAHFINVITDTKNENERLLQKLEDIRES